VTWLGEFSPIGWLFPLQFFNLVLLFRVMYYFWFKTGLGYIFGNYFHTSPGHPAANSRPIKTSSCYQRNKRFGTALATGWPNEFVKNNSQNVAQNIFVKFNALKNLTVEKVYQKCGLLPHFSRSKQKRKFDQYGHPGWQAGRCISTLSTRSSEYYPTFFCNFLPAQNIPPGRAQRPVL
jgi:hypothetical protein